MQKIAFPTTDGQTLSGHFGGASLFLVISQGEDGVLLTEQRPKPVHSHGAGKSHAHPEMADGAARANNMFAAIEDCQVLIARSMGQPAYQRAQSLGMQVFLVAERNIQAALAAYRSGTLVSDMRRVHRETS